MQNWAANFTFTARRLHLPASVGDVQRIRYNTANVFVNANNLPSYIIGPWFEATMSGGVFMNFPSSRRWTEGIKV